MRITRPQVPRELTPRQRELMEEFAEDEATPKTWTATVKKTLSRLKSYLSSTAADDNKAA